MPGLVVPKAGTKVWRRRSKTTSPSISRGSGYRLWMLSSGAAGMSPPGGRKPELYRWKRIQEKPRDKPAFDYDNVEHWIKKVEEASEFAVSEVFSTKKTGQRWQKTVRPVLDLESVEQLHDHDEAYSEARDLLSDWMSSKLRMELDEEDIAAEMNPPPSPQQPRPEFVKYQRFDDLYEYLEQEAERSDTQGFLQQLLQKEVMDSGILENLRSDQNHQKQRDPRLTMELRHQQVKENRERRQKALERQRQERALKKDTMAQAQALVQEEAKQKALKIRKEEEEIQRVMVKLRKDMTVRRKAVEEARRIEWNKKEMESRHAPQGKTEAELEPRKEENGRRKLENHAGIQTRLAQVYTENRRCLQRYFSAWYKLVLERRVKMGKARALADWKCQLRAFRAWRDHVWARKMEQESQKMETDLREQNRKQQLASESYRQRLLRQHFAAWQLWCLAEKDQRQLEAHKEETKRKMAALLDAASSLATSNAKSTEQRDVSDGGSAYREQTTDRSKAPNDGPRIAMIKKMPTQPPGTPKYAWQVTRKHAELTPEELEQHRLQSSRSTPRHTAGAHKQSSPCGEVYKNRHNFQQQLIEEQRRQLQEQKEMILGLVENQRLFISRREATQATAVTAEVSSNGAPGKGRSQEEPPALDNREEARFVCPSVHPGNTNTSPSPSAVSTARRCSAPRDSPHPAVRAMEERAAQRLERKRELEETRRRRQEEKLAQLKAAEEERVQREAAEREAEAERRREEKRLQKQLEQEKQQRLQRERELQVKACAHYQKTLLRRRGLDPWKKLMAESRLAAEHAEERHRATVMKKCLVAWQDTVRDIIASKVSRADQLQMTILLRRGFRHWVKYKNYLSILEERADRHHAATVRKKTFLAWMDLAQEEKLAMWQKQRAAAEHNQRRILLAAFRMWRNFPKFMQELKRKEERREMLRKRVAEILPDFRL